MKDKAYAKINLFLDVTGIRNDGYHNIASIMQTVDLCDDIEIVTNNENRIIVVCDDPNIPTDGRNLVSKASTAFFDCFSIENRGITISIKKRIPSSAGLAGGSSDAASVLRILCKMYGIVLDDRIYSLSSTVGADIPFCLKGGTDICEGIGERLTPISNNTEVYFVLAKGSGEVSTPFAYREVDRFFNKSFCANSSGLENCIRALHSGNVTLLCNNLFNIFETVVPDICPEVNKSKIIMKECGASATLLSGSGPSVFGVFLKESDAENAVITLKNKNFSSFLCRKI